MTTGRMVLLVLLLADATVHAQGAPTKPAAGDPASDDTSTTRLPEVVVRGRAEDLGAAATSGSQGAIGAVDLEVLKAPARATTATDR
jgi:hypothetical protein